MSLGGLGHPGGIILEVVTGVGRHSSAGQPRLLPAVVRFLSDAGYRFDTQVSKQRGVVDFFGVCVRVVNWTVRFLSNAGYRIDTQVFKRLVQLGFWWVGGLLSGWCASSRTQATV